MSCLWTRVQSGRIERETCRVFKLETSRPAARLRHKRRSLLSTTALNQRKTPIQTPPLPRAPSPSLAPELTLSGTRLVRIRVSNTRVRMQTRGRRMHADLCICMCRPLRLRIYVFACTSFFACFPPRRPRSFESSSPKEEASACLPTVGMLHLTFYHVPVVRAL